jgi:hypothetical protein
MVSALKELAIRGAFWDAPPITFASSIDHT